MWFPAKGEATGPAKRVCARCPVLSECQAWVLGLDHEEFGVWGGMSERERRQLRSGTPKPRPHSPQEYRERAARIRAMSASGMSAADIAAEVGGTASSVWGVLARSRREGAA